uniref:Uncharacterized protein n=1 Tax=Meloidogyne enterolobii TaxID=390850 RepID=A0A6V7VHS5_MELEN|nr:unnamed protein product [Meloidogyne enterolobii]
MKATCGCLKQHFSPFLQLFPQLWAEISIKLLETIKIVKRKVKIKREDLNIFGGFFKFFNENNEF